MTILEKFKFLLNNNIQIIFDYTDIEEKIIGYNPGYLYLSVYMSKKQIKKQINNCYNRILIHLDPNKKEKNNQLINKLEELTYQHRQITII